jgi:manganese/iron transport system substrate-binding protein
VSEGITPLPIREGSYEGKPNPHAWMSLSAAMIYVDNIAAAFSKADPDNAAAYAQNAQDYKALLTQNIAPLRDKVQAIPEDQRWLVSCEGAFSYLAQDLGLREAYLWPINADETGTPQQVRAVIDTVRENNIPAVFCESTVNNDPAQQVARETGARFGGVLYVDSLSAEDGPVPSFVDLLRVSTQTVVDGLTGP